MNILEKMAKEQKALFQVFNLLIEKTCMETQSGPNLLFVTSLGMNKNEYGEGNSVCVREYVA